MTGLEAAAREFVPAVETLLEDFDRRCKALERMQSALPT